MKIKGAKAQWFALLGTVYTVAAADLTVQVAQQPVPADCADPIQKAVKLSAIQVLEAGKPVFEFWFSPDIPLKSKPESADKELASLAEITFLGVAKVGPGRRDYKDNEIAAGTYTIRFGLQPQDGDHLGTSEFPYFAVLIPAKSDTGIEAIKTYKAMVKASGKGTATGHPIVLALRPSTGPATASPVLTTPAPDHKAIRLSLPGKAPDADKPVPLDFELVVEGKYKS